MKTELKVKFLQHLNQKKSEEGFTLIELLVVVIIIGILAAVALPSLLSQTNKAKQVEARNFTGSMNRAQQAVYLEKQEFAGVIGDLGVGVKDSGNYSYTIKGGGKDSTDATNQATAGVKTLKSYAGYVYTTNNVANGVTESLSLAVLCESLNPGGAIPTGSTDPAKPCGDDVQLGK